MVEVFGDHTTVKSSPFSTPGMVVAINLDLLILQYLQHSIFRWFDSERRGPARDPKLISLYL
jgi:hypothetical protein